MNERFCREALSQALALGADNAEAYFRRGESLAVDILNGELDAYHSSVDEGVSLRVTKGAKTGYAYTQAMDDAAFLAGQAVANAEALEKEENHPYFEGGEYQALADKADCSAPGTAKLTELACELERAALNADERVRRVQHCKVFWSRTRVRILNTRGLDADRRVCETGAYVVPIVKQGEEERNGFAFRLGKAYTQTQALADEAVREALDQLGAQPVPGGTYAAVLRHDAASDLLSAFAGMFSAENAQKGLSLLKGREGERLGAPCLHIIDDPLLEQGYAPSPFDDEGVPAARTEVMEGGVLKTLLHNLKTAAKDGKRTTGNAGKVSTAAPIGVLPTQLFIAPGDAAPDALLAQMGQGLYITDFSGLHAGANAVSGDFSLLCRGFWVSGGKQVYPVAQITAAGNFLEWMRRVVAVGNDLRFALPGAGGCFGSPSLLLESLVISG